MGLFANGAGKQNINRCNMKESPLKNSIFKFLFPIDGDFLTNLDGAIENGGVKITVKLSAATGCDLYVNGNKAEFINGEYRSDVTLTDYRTVLSAFNKTTGKRAETVVYYLKNAARNFMLSSDDNILFLKDITDHKDEYSSIFDNPYLAVYKKAHDTYGAKARLNLFYELDDTAANCFNPKPEYFNLSMMTDKFKKEFIENSDWLKLAFHAKSEFPDKPYSFSPASEIRRDAIAVIREITRFAGVECLTETTTTHWGSANKECVRALRSLGYRMLTGYFENRDGEYIVSYYLSDELSEHVGERDFYRDRLEGVTFGRLDLVLNERSFADMERELLRIIDHKGRGGFVGIMIHEQYFYKTYKNHLPDFSERVFAALKILTERGYACREVIDAVKEPALCENPAFSLINE